MTSSIHSATEPTPSSIDEIIKATAAWLLVPRTEASGRATQAAESVVVRTDAPWAAAANAYLDATRVLERAKASQSLAKMALYGLACNPQERGCGVVVEIPGRWSGIDSGKAIALLGIDPQRYWDQCVAASVGVDSGAPNLNPREGYSTADRSPACQTPPKQAV